MITIPPSQMSWLPHVQNDIPYKSIQMGKKVLKDLISLISVLGITFPEHDSANDTVPWVFGNVQNNYFS